MKGIHKIKAEGLKNGSLLGKSCGRHREGVLIFPGIPRCSTLEVFLPYLLPQDPFLDNEMKMLLKSRAYFHKYSQSPLFWQND